MPGLDTSRIRIVPTPKGTIPDSGHAAPVANRDAYELVRMANTMFIMILRYMSVVSYAQDCR